MFRDTASCEVDLYASIPSLLQLHSASHWFWQTPHYLLKQPLQHDAAPTQFYWADKLLCIFPGAKALFNSCPKETFGFILS